METPAEPNFVRKRRWPRRLLIWSLIGAGALAALWLVSFVVALRARDAALQRLRDQGKPTTLEELVARRGAPDEETTSVGDLRKAMELNRELGKPGDTLSLAFNAANGSPEAALTDSNLKLLESGEPILALIRSAVAKPASWTYDPRVPLEESDWAQQYRSLNRLLSARARIELAQGDAQTAYDSVDLQFALAKQLETEPFVIPQLIRIALLGVASHDLRLCLNSAAPSQERFQSLDRRLTAALDGVRWSDVLDGEALLLSAEVHNSQTLREHFLSSEIELSTFWMRSRLGLEAHKLRFMFVRSDLGLPMRLNAQTEFLAVPDEVRTLMDQQRNASAAERTKLAEHSARFCLDRVLGSSGIGWLEVCCDSGKRILRYLTLTRWALHLRRCYDAHGSLPERLDAIRSDMMPALDAAGFENATPKYEVHGRRARVQFDDALAAPHSCDADEHRSTYGILLELDFGDPPHGRPPAAKR